MTTQNTPIESTNEERVVRSGPSLLDFKKNADVAKFPDLFSRHLLSYGELYYWEKGKIHIVTKSQHAKEVLTSKDYSADRGAFFVSRMPNLDLRIIQDFFGVVRKMMVMSDDDDHTRRRKAAALGFEDHVLHRFENKMRETVTRLIENLKGKSHVEFVETVSKILPSTVLADLFSIPEADRANFLQWSNTMTGFFGGASAYRNEDGVEVNTAALNLKNYFTELVKDRQAKPGNDYVSLLLESQKTFALSHDELISQLIMMLVAGMATTTDQINNCVFLLAAHPEMQAEVRRNKILIPAMFEECKRFDPAVTFTFRVARAKTKLGNQPIEQGDVLFISNHAVNRDLPESERPFELNIHRRAQHFAYGHGSHYCIGAKLARMEMQNLFEEILTRLPPFRIDESKLSERDHYSLSFSGFKEMHLKFDS